MLGLVWMRPLGCCFKTGAGWEHLDTHIILHRHASTDMNIEPGWCAYSQPNNWQMEAERANLCHTFLASSPK